MSRFLLSLALVAIVSTSVSADDLENVKCVINPKASAKAEASAEYMGGKVYFCCNNCADKFKADQDKYATAANYQLVATAQYKQKACPMSGGNIAEDVSSKVGNVDVGFCCKNCKSKVDEAEGDAKHSLVFSKAAFKKGFDSAKDDDVDLSDVNCFMMDEPVSAKFAVDYMKAKVYFCCESCVEDFSENHEEYISQANMQLVQTQQYTQTGCPFSGAAVKEGTQVKVGDTEVGFCCGNCKSKVENAKDDDAKVAMVFGQKSFAKGFKKAGDED